MVKQIDDYENISVNKNKRKSEKIEERDVDHDNKEVERVAEVEGAFVQTESNQSISSATKYNMNELKKVLNNSQSLYSNEEDVDDDEGDNANEASENEDGKYFHIDLIILINQFLNFLLKIQMPKIKQI